MEYLIFGVIFLIFLLGIFLVFKFSWQKKSLPKTRISFFEKRIKVISNASYSSKEQILEYDKIFHYIMKDLGYEGSLGDILKASPSEINDLNEAWRLHKMRNKIAHELLDGDYEEIKLRKFSKDFKAFLHNLLGEIK